MEKRTFYKTVVTVSIISEEPLNSMDLNASSIVRGRPTVFDVKVDRADVSGGEAAHALYKAGSYPGYFRLDDDGNYHEDRDRSEDWPEQSPDALGRPAH